MMIDADAQIIDFVDCSDPAGAIKVIPDLQQGGMAIRLGQGFDAGSKVKSWLIVNASGGQISGTVVLSDAGFRNFRMFGTVNVIDVGIARAQNNQAFIGNVDGVTAGNYTRSQLWNPPGSGVSLYVETVTAGSDQAGSPLLATSSTNAGFVTSTRAAPKLLSGSAPKAILSSTSTTSGALAGIFAGIYLQAGATLKYPLKSPIIVPPGYGLLVAHAVLGARLTVNFEWYEQ